MDTFGCCALSPAHAKIVLQRIANRIYVKVKTLIIEDEQDAVATLTTCLQMRWSELQIVSTARGSEGAALVEKERPDLVILDLGLPDMDGMQTRHADAETDTPLL